MKLNQVTGGLNQFLELHSLLQRTPVERQKNTVLKSATLFKYNRYKLQFGAQNFVNQKLVGNVFNISEI